MALEKTTLKRLSICECGFRTLSDHIKLGTEYEINPELTTNFDFTCGGCGKTFPVVGVFVAKRGRSHAGYLPKQIFEAPV